MMTRIYLAAPFFNEEQCERERRCAIELRRLGYEVFAPFETGVLGPSDSLWKRAKIFQQNINILHLCDVCFVITDGKDVGTIWEAGYASALRDTRIASGLTVRMPFIIYYCETLGDNPFNVMLAQSADCVMTSFLELQKLPGILANGGSRGRAYSGPVQ